MEQRGSKAMSRRQGGFTLIEMLVATILAGVLASFAYQQYTVAVQNAQERNVQAALQAVASAEASYAMSHHGQMGQITDLINAGLLANATLNNMPYNITVPPVASVRDASPNSGACMAYATPTDGNLPAYYIDNAQRIQQGDATNCGNNLYAGLAQNGYKTGNAPPVAPPPPPPALVAPAMVASAPVGLFCGGDSGHDALWE